MSSIEVIEESNSGNEWVLDSLVGFLKGPLWSQPLFSFMDEKSVDDGSNDKEYEVIFQEYRDCVGKLLESHMEELGISAPQFEKACEEAEGVLSRKFHQALFEQVWAGNDFTSFKRMMIQINIDLQLWALEILASRYGRVPNAFLPEGYTPEDFLTGDDFFLREAKRRSMINTDVVDSVSRRLTKVTVSVERPPSGILDDDSPEVQQESEAQGQTFVPTSNPFAGDSEGQVPNINEISVDRTGYKGEVKFDKATAQNAPTSAHRLPEESMNADEIKHRQDYLRRQRDKLLGLKQQEREKQAERLDRLEKSGRRPQTAKFMALEDAKEDGHKQKTRAYMRSLAARIKAEVMDTDADDDKK